MDGYVFIVIWAVLVALVLLAVALLAIMVQSLEPAGEDDREYRNRR